MKLTHIIPGRNDNYAGFFDDRLILTMKYNFHLYKRLGIDCEFIFVEWAPDPTKPLLSEKLDVVFSDENFKSYVVDEETQNSIRQKRTWMTFLEFFAKNVGIRRASNDYILCSNADIFIGDSVMENFKDNLAENIIYRAERHDVDMEKIQSLDEESFVKSILRTHRFPEHDKIFVDGSGDFTLAHRNLWNKLTGYDENQRFVKVHKDSRLLFSAEMMKAEFLNLGSVYHLDHGTSLANTGPSIQKYRLANGPYTWKYMLNLPYTNLGEWGLYGDGITEEQRPNSRIYDIVVDPLKILEFRDDKEYFTPNTPLGDKFKW